MPNLTDALNNEDKPTIEALCTNICLRLDGGNSIDAPTAGADQYIPFEVDDVYEAGFKWTDDLAQTWTNVVQRGVGYSIFYNTSQKLHITTDALQLELDSTGLGLDGHPIPKSDPSAVTGADSITNIMSLTQLEYDAIVTPDPSTLYVIVG